MTQQHTRAADNGPNMAPPVQVISKTVTKTLGATVDCHRAELETSSPHLLEAGDHLLNPRQVEALTAASYRKGLSDGTKETDLHWDIEVKALQGKINAVYRERNELAIALARLTLLRQNELGRGKGSWAGYGFDDKTGRAVVYVQLPSGHQISWHMDDDTSAMFASALGAKPLPEFDGQWDGTFIGREENWAVRHIYAQDVYAYDNGSPAEPETNCPEGATHYRVCSGGKFRYYHLDPVTGWHYYHANANAWYPTDLSADYLEAHIRRLDCDTTAVSEPKTTVTYQGGTITNLIIGDFPRERKPLTRQQACGYGMVFGLDVVGGDATHVMMPCELHGLPGAIYRVSGAAVDQYVIFAKTEELTRYEWRPAAVSAEWVEKHAHPIIE